MSIMDQVKTNLREWYSLAADRTGEMAKISVRMYDKYGISREIERQLSELGSYVYHAVEQGRSDFAEDEEFTAWIDRIKELEKDLDAKVAEIDEIRVARQEKQAAREREEAEAREAGTEDAEHREAEAAAGAGAAGSSGPTEAGAEPEPEPEPERRAAAEAASEDAAAEDPVESLETEEAAQDPDPEQELEDHRRTD
jgi:hypothetical protein